MSLDVASSELLRAAGRAGRLHALVRGLECAAAGMLGGAVVFAAGVASGAIVATSLVVVSAMVAAITASLAWRERTPVLADVTRRADTTARLEGALPAVLDRARAEERATTDQTAPRTASDIASLLALRVRAAVSPRDLARAALPRSPLALAAPLLAMALVVVALDRRPQASAATSGTAAGLRGAAERSRAAGERATADALEIAARRVESVERSEADGGTEADPAARQRAARELESLARTLPADDAARRALEQAARTLDPARADRSQGPVPEGLASSEAAGPGAPPAAGTGASPSGAGSSASSPGLANASGDGRMLGPPAGGESDPQSGGPASGTVATGGPGRGVPSARWWPSRYDAVVERYLAP